MENNIDINVGVVIGILYLFFGHLRGGGGPPRREPKPPKKTES